MVRVNSCPCMAKKKATFPRNSHLNSGIERTEYALGLRLGGDIFEVLMIKRPLEHLKLEADG